MKTFKSIIAWVLTLCMLVSVIPMNVFANNSQTTYEDTSESASASLSANIDGDIYTIKNKALTYSFNKKTGGFSIDTLEGHPEKLYDNNIPLLYKDDADRSNGTSFITVRIDGKDYIFGQDYRYYKLGLPGNVSNLKEPVISEEGRLITIEWTIKDITVIKKIAVSLDEDNDKTGNVGISFEVKNNSGEPHDIGIRLLLDTALGNAIDAPYVVADDALTPTYVEKEFVGEDVPAQLRNVDALSNTRIMSYLITKGWEGGIEPNKIIVGHWANMANTKYDYTADKYCDFTNYSNEYGVPDSAISVYWEKNALAAGESFVGESLYGVGNFSDKASEHFGINVTTDKVELASDGKSYKNDGIIDVDIEIDNSLDTSDKLNAVVVNVSFDENDYEAVGAVNNTLTYIEKGSATLLNFKLKAKPQDEICAGEIYVSVSAVKGELESGNTESVENMVERSVVLPSVKGKKPALSIRTVKPDTVYYKGTKAITVTGTMKNFDVLSVNDGWDLMMYHATSDHKVRIEKKNISFLDDEYTAMSFKTDEELALGDYIIEFEFDDEQLVSAFGKTMTAWDFVSVSDNPKYALPSYGIIALVRSTDTSVNDTTYDFFTFSGEGEYQSFYDGQLTAIGGLTGKTLKYDFGENVESILENEILITLRGDFRQMQRQVDGPDGPVTETYWQAEKQDGAIIINNILSYEGDKPMEVYRDGREFIIKGDGLLKVINSVNIWRSEWKIQAHEDIVYTLDAERADALVGTKYPLELQLEGAGMMVQSLGGFLIDLHYGEFTSDWYDESDGRVTYGIGFGGMASIPIADDSTKEKKGTHSGLSGSSVSTGSGTTSGTGTTTRTSKRGKLQRKSTGLTDGQISAEITNVLFGEKGKVEDNKVVIEDKGFVGIDTTVSFGMPQDVLGSFITNGPGLMVGMTINTINNIYEFDLGISIRVLECEVNFGFKEATIKGKTAVYPNRLEFHLRNGLAIPIGPVGTPAFITGLGGGIDGLADTMGGNFSGLPPITIVASMRIQVIKLLIGDFTARLNLEGLSITGELTINDRKELLDINAGLSARWVSPWSINLYGNINVLDGIIKGGLTVTIADDYFYGYIYAAICVPEAIPLVGGRKLASVEAAASKEFVGCNVEIIGIKFGVIYYWGESVKFSDGYDLSPPAEQTMAMLSGSNAYSYEDEKSGAMIFAGTNTHLLSATGQTAALYSGTDGFEQVSVSIGEAEKQDNLLFVIPYSGDISQQDELILVNPNSTRITLEPDDGNGGGNYVTQIIPEKGSYVYVSVTDTDLIKSGKWTFEYNSDITVGNITVQGVDNISDISEVSISHSDSDNFKLDAEWSVTGNCEDVTSLDIFLTKDKDIVEKIKTSNNTTSGLGDKLLHLEDVAAIKAGKAVIDIPESYENGKYYAVAMFSTIHSAECVISDTYFEFVNPNLPNPVKSASVEYGANGDLLVSVADADDADYTHYLIEVNASDGTVLSENITQYKKGDEYMYIGKEANLVPGEEYYVIVRTLREEHTAPLAGSNEPERIEYFYGSDAVKTNTLIMPEIQKPKLVSVEINYDTDKQNVNQTDFYATYTFDRPVWFGANLRGQNYYFDEQYKTVWEVDFEDLEDGDYFVDFVATAENGDYTTGAECESYYPNARHGFSVDTSNPVLSLAQTSNVSLDGNNTQNAVGTNVVMTNEDGSYEIRGMTEVDAELTVDGSTEGLVIENRSTFVYSGKLAEDEESKVHVFKSTDKAGNISELVVNVINSNSTGFVSIKLLADGKEVSKDTPLEIASASEVTLSVVGKTESGKEYTVSNDQIEYSILYPKNTAYITDGVLNTYTPGETAIKAKLRDGTVETSDGKLLSLGLEDYFIINIVENSKIDLKDAITSAQNKLDTATGKPQSAKDALKTAIEKAQNVYDDPDADGADYTEAIRALGAAVTVFDRASTKPAGPGGVVDNTSRDDDKDDSNNIRGKKDELYYFVLPKGADGNTYAPYYVENGVKQYVRMSAAADGRLYFIAPADALYYMEQNKPYFDDIENHWAKDNINYAAARNLFNGVGEEIFDPNGKMTRAMFVTVLGRMTGVDQSEFTTSGFTDVPTGQWYSAYVEWAAKNGIVNGYGNDKFGPDDPVTREQMCAIINRYIDKYGYRISEVTPKQNFNDDSKISEYAKQAVYYCQTRGLIIGKDGGNFAPQDPSTRAEVATFMMRLIGRIIDSKR